MALLTAILSFLCVTVASTQAAHDSQRSGSEGNALRRALHQLQEENADDHLALLQAGMEQKINKAQPSLGASEDVENSAEACESFEKGYRSVDASADIDDVQAAPTSPSIAEVQAAPTSPSIAEATLEEEPYGAATLKTALEAMIVILFLDGLRRWRLQQQENEGREKVKAAFAESDAAADRAWQEFVLAAHLGDELGAEKALSKEVPVQRADTWGCAPLHFVAVGGSAKVASDLLKLGAEVDAVDACDESALHFAARAGHPGICEVLLNNGADVNLPNNQDMTPLVVAGHAKQESTCRFLADHGGHAGGMADEDLPPLVICQVMRKVLEAA